MIIGQWWNDKNIDLVEIDGKVYALHGWNGEAWLDCWECIGDEHMEVGETGIEIQPVYVEVEEDEFQIVEYVVK